ncbi:1-deoxy-D-xylulose-5-phosphate reductoisomerase [Vallitalea okinawensis]|uniref:1-deoxy-D-xylulose-5-phosphate reductoisomerase n=1 Tax=Vallitalea okinawensis TaxID=2078660 RepID=UPI000CFB5028|nr:1-deoxy-D-xylulose-5-phosphate reductoisomerase [Vallitalea okinawensis]
MKKISILGSTGSIGTQAIDVLKNLKMEVLGLTAHSNIELLEQQIYELQPLVVAVTDHEKALELRRRLRTNLVETKVVSGIEGLIEVATLDEVDIVLTSIVGMVGLRPTVAAIEAGKHIALANKETLVTAGELIMPLAKQHGVMIYPVDSEHSAIFQCLQGNNAKEVEKIILTASGGPFRGKTINELRNVTLSDALNHPNWSMGKKITIDSATLMNKGLEVIEAKWLFDLDIKDLEVVVHPQSIIHSMVLYQDGSYMAQLGQPDMRVPIQYALTYPKRIKNNFQRLDFTGLKDLTFEKPDQGTFQCLQLAFDALARKGTQPTVLNAANEEAVNLFLNNQCSFLDIPEIILQSMDAHRNILEPTLDDILEVENWTRNFVKGRWSE